MATPCFPQKVCHQLRHQFTVNFFFLVCLLVLKVRWSKGGTSPYLKGEVTLSSWFLVSSLSQRTKFSNWERLWYWCAKLRNCWEASSQWGQPSSLAGVDSTTLQSVPAGVQDAPTGVPGYCSSSWAWCSLGQPCTHRGKNFPLWMLHAKSLQFLLSLGWKVWVILSGSKLQFSLVNLASSDGIFTFLWCIFITKISGLFFGRMLHDVTLSCASSTNTVIRYKGEFLGRVSCIWVHSNKSVVMPLVW